MDAENTITQTGLGILEFRIVNLLAGHEVYTTEIIDRLRKATAVPPGEVGIRAAAQVLLVDRCLHDLREPAGRSLAGNDRGRRNHS